MRPPRCATIGTVANERLELPAHLLQAVADRTGRVALVVGAGCSLESPTSLELSSTYAVQVHDQLLLDEVLADGECAEPSDLSAVTSAVWSKTHSQEPVVTRLPRARFRNAQANDGYLAAAALLREGAVSAVLSLNFDLAMSHALMELSADEVAVIADPASIRDLGSHIVVYLHRNVNETNFDDWILRVEALREEWRGQWEQVLSQRVMTTSVVVFAGLGSPTAVLIESVKWIRERLDPSQHQAYVVDPSATTQFQAALDLPDESHIQMGWCDFMRHLAERLSAQLRIALVESCTELCTSNAWPDEVPFIEQVCEAFFDRGLVSSGKQRARWLLHNRSYLPDEEHSRASVGYLLLGLGLAERHLDGTLTIRQDGVVEFRKAGRVSGSCLPVSGGGTHHWTAIEPRIQKSLRTMRPYEMPTAILLGGMQGALPTAITPPEDVLYEEIEGDIAGGSPDPAYLTVDELRADPTTAIRMIA